LALVEIRIDSASLGADDRASSANLARRSASRSIAELSSLAIPAPD
jgi:hypothetical protein